MHVHCVTTPLNADFQAHSKSPHQFVLCIASEPAYPWLSHAWGRRPGLGIWVPIWDTTIPFAVMGRPVCLVNGDSRGDNRYRIWSHTLQLGHQFLVEPR